MSVTHLSSPAIVDLPSCQLLANTDKPFILALKLGENLFDSLLQCASMMHLKSATLSGLGALDEVTVAYYNLATKQYQTKLFRGMYELISLNGNIAIVDGKPFVHIHAALGTEDYAVVGGHIMSATVGPSAEITIIPFSASAERKYDAVTGLKLLCPGLP